MARSGRGWDAKPPPAPATTRGRAVDQRRRGPTQPSDPPTDSASQLGPRDPARLREAMEEFAAGLDRGAGRRRGERGAGDFWRARRGAQEEPAEQGSRDPHEVAREICLKQLAVRPRTRAELAQALRKRGVDGQVAAAVLDRYDEVGLIDDVAFARAWVTSRHHGRGLASRALAQELRQRGVSKEDTDEALSELDSDTEAQTALDLATRRLRSMHGEPEAIFRRLVGMLARKGYPAGVALRAVKDALASRDSELAELIDPDAYEE